LLRKTEGRTCKFKEPCCMTVSTENATFSKSTKSRNSNSLVQNQIKSNSQFEFVPCDKKECKCLNLVDFEGVTLSVESVIQDSTFMEYTL